MSERLSSDSTVVDSSSLDERRLVSRPPLSEPILSQWDNEELRRLEERLENPYSGMLHALLDWHSDLDLTGKVHGIDNSRSIPGGYSDIVYGYCTGPDGIDYKVAVKRLRLHVMEDRDFQKKLTKELYIWSKLNNRRILPLDGFFLEDSNYPSLVSRWMENGTVLKYLEARPDVDLLRLVTGIAEGITYLHLNRIVHSDIKPDNVLISESGGPLLCDFGVSRMLVASRSFDFSSSLTGGGLRGTLRFMSKELLRATDLSPATYSTASDVWAFGMTVLSILTRKVPYHYISNNIQVITAITKGLLPTTPPDIHGWPTKNQILFKMCTFCWKPVANRRSIQSFTLELQLLEHVLSSSHVSAATYRFQVLEGESVDRIQSSRAEPDTSRRKYTCKGDVRVYVAFIVFVILFGVIGGVIAHERLEVYTHIPFHLSLPSSEDRARSLQIVQSSLIRLFHDALRSLRHYSRTAARLTTPVTNTPETRKREDNKEEKFSNMIRIMKIRDLVEKKFPNVLFERLRRQEGKIALVKDSQASMLDNCGTESTSSAPTSPGNVSCSESGKLQGLDVFLPSRIHPDAAEMSSDGELCPRDDSSLCTTDDPSTKSQGKEDGTETVLDEIIDFFVDGTDPIYLKEEKRWSGWPETPKSEGEWVEDVADFLNKIIETAFKFLYGEECLQQDFAFSVEYTCKLGGVDEKPDLVLVPCEPCEDSDCDAWDLVRAIAMVKPENHSLNDFAEELEQHARMTAGAQNTRRFTLGFGLANTTMTLFKFDRSGILASSRFDVHRCPRRLVRVILGMALGEDYYLGHDPSFLYHDDKVYVQLNEEAYEIIETLHTDSDIQGRGSHLLLVIHPRTGGKLVIKDQWVDRDFKKEHEWLELLRGENLPKIVRLEDFQLVRFSVGHQKPENDDTETDRKEANDHQKRAVIFRDHFRLLLSPYGTRLRKFQSLKELVSVFKDYAESIRDLYKTGYFHRDISVDNLVIVDECNGPVRTGYVIDFECTTVVGSDEAACAGTTPFMAIELLKTLGGPHKFYFDLESLFHVLVWICLTEDGPRSKDCHPESKFKFAGSVLDGWDAPNNMTSGSAYWLSRRKFSTMYYCKYFQEDILDLLPGYFKPIEELLRELRTILFQYYLDYDGTAAEDRKPIHDRKDIDGVFRRYIDALKDATLKLPDTDEGLTDINTPNHHSLLITANEQEIQKSGNPDGNQGLPRRISTSQKDEDIGASEERNARVDNSDQHDSIMNRDPKGASIDGGSSGSDCTDSNGIVCVGESTSPSSLLSRNDSGNDSKGSELPRVQCAKRLYEPDQACGASPKRCRAN
ncbi:hypothetical protein ACEPAI_3039 [Sanghuangporus weigelae]